MAEPRWMTAAEHYAQPGGVPGGSEGSLQLKQGGAFAGTDLTNLTGVPGIGWDLTSHGGSLKLTDGLNHNALIWNDGSVHIQFSGVRVVRFNNNGMFMDFGSPLNLDSVGLRFNATDVASLPTGVAAGAVTTVYDGQAALAWGATVLGGGSSQYLVWYNGTAWTVMAK